MSSPSCIVFYGLRFEVFPQDIGALEARSDERIAAARSARLDFYWGNFGVREDRYLLFIGAQIGIVGQENRSEIEISEIDLQSIAATVSRKLSSTVLDGPLKLYVQLMQD